MARQQNTRPLVRETGWMRQPNDGDVVWLANDASLLDAALSRYAHL